MTFIPKISQSLIKDAKRYQSGDMCGLQFEWAWINPDNEVRELYDSEAMNLGRAFEFAATGQHDYWGRVPKTAGTEAYRRAHRQAQRFKAIIEEYGWEIVTFGQRHEKGNLSAYTDLIVRPKDTRSYWPFEGGDSVESLMLSRSIIDLKYSGLFGRNAYGPEAWTVGNLAENPDKTTQAIQYVHVTGIPNFAYFVFDSGTNEGAKLFPVQVGPEAIAAHLEQAEKVHQMLKVHAITGAWAPKPEYMRCRKCPLAEGCTHKITAPVAEEVTKLR